MNDCHSLENKINCGVPQGSVLGPLLFLIFINDIPLVRSKMKSYSSLFADDLSSFFIFNKINKPLIKEVNKYLEDLTNWLAKWRMIMNVNKCCYTIFSKSGNKNNKFAKQLRINLNLKGELIPYNKEPVFLGITFDEYLCFNKHIEQLRKKSRIRINIIKILSHLNKTKLINIYKALIGSLFNYS